MTRGRRWRLGLALLSAIVAGGLAAAVVAGWQLARPVPARIGDPPPSLAAERVSFHSESGSTIHAWFVPAKSPRGAVVLLPPVRSNRLGMVRRAEFLSAAGYTTLLIDFQATGESPGEAITFGWRERFDVLGAVQFVRERAPGTPVALIGVSLGGAAALLATPPLDVEAMVLEAVYPTLDTAIENRMRIRLGVAAPLLSPLLSVQLRPRLGVSSELLRPLDHIGNVRAPVFIIGGMDDRHTTQEDTRRLFDAANEPKQLWLLPGVAHVDFFDASPADYGQRVMNFLHRSLSASRYAAR